MNYSAMGRTLAHLAQQSVLVTSLRSFSCVLSRSHHVFSVAPSHGRSSRFLHTYDVSPFGRFVFEGPGSVNVAPLTPLEYPDMDKCILDCAGDESQWSVDVSDDACVVRSDSDECADAVWHVKLPLQYSLTIRSGDKAAISGMESQNVQVSAGGDITLHNLRCGEVSVKTDASLSIQRMLLGNLTAEAEEVNSSAARLQGQSISVSARRSCHLADVYADRVCIDVPSGDLSVGTIHGEAEIRTDEGTGELRIAGVEGSVDISAECAAVRCHVHQLHADSRIHCRGAVWVTLSPSVCCTLQVPGPPPLLDSGLETVQSDDGTSTCRVGDGDGPTLLVESDTRPMVDVKSWAETVTNWS